MKRIAAILIIGALSGIIFVTDACKKHTPNTETDYNQELLTVQDYMYPQQFANQFMITFFKVFSDSILINDGISKIDSAKAVYINQNDTLKIAVEYWSDETSIWHHIDSYGHYRAGTYAFITDSLFMQNSTGDVLIKIIRPFYYDSLLVNIDQIHISKTGINEKGNQTYKAVFNNIVMDGIYADKFTYKFSAEFNYELFKHASSDYSNPDDYFLFSGLITGNTLTGIGYSTQISSDTSRYKINYNCCQTIEGKSELTFNGNEIDLGHVNLDFISEDGCANYYMVAFPNKFTVKSPIE